MLFSVGTKVKFLHTGDLGEVTALLDNGMLNVYIPSSDMEIPVFPEDLIRSEVFITKSQVKAKIVQGKQDKKTEEPERPEIESQYQILKSYGIQLAFDPVGKEDGTTEKYTMFLINDTHFDVVYNLSLNFGGEEEQRWNGKLTATSILKLGTLLFDDLNDAPGFDLECWQDTTAGKGKIFNKSLKIKAKQFFKNVRTAPFLNKKVHIYRLVEKFETSSDKPIEDLKTYTKKKVKPSKYRYTNIAEFSTFDTKDLANFEPELDLHIENLSEDYRKMSNAEIVRLQLSRFDSYIQNAIRLGVPRVFIIHGVGKGRLKDEIASKLFKNPDVKTFKNEFHPRYGWGATEVIF